MFSNCYHWIGVVTNNRDPDKAGKVQVRIIGVHDKLEESDLPWIPSIMPPVFGGTSEVTVPPPALQRNARVFGIALDGPMMQQNLVLGICTNAAVIDEMARNSSGGVWQGAAGGGGIGDYYGPGGGPTTNKLDMSNVDVSHCNGDIACMRQVYGAYYDSQYRGWEYSQARREGSAFDCSSYARRREASIQAAINSAAGYNVYDPKFQSASYFGYNTAGMAGNLNFGESRTTGLSASDIRTQIEAGGPGDYIVMFTRSGRSNHTMTFTKHADGSMTMVESGNIGAPGNTSGSSVHTVEGYGALTTLENRYGGSGVHYTIINTNKLANPAPTTP
jgi:hypothetical protein